MVVMVACKSCNFAVCETCSTMLLAQSHQPLTGEDRKTISKTKKGDDGSKFQRICTICAEQDKNSATAVVANATTVETLPQPTQTTSPQSSMVDSDDEETPASPSGAMKNKRGSIVATRGDFSSAGSPALPARDSGVKKDAAFEAARKKEREDRDARRADMEKEAAMLSAGASRKPLPPLPASSSSSSSSSTTTITSTAPTPSSPVAVVSVSSPKPGVAVVQRNASRVAELGTPSAPGAGQLRTQVFIPCMFQSLSTELITTFTLSPPYRLLQAAKPMWMNMDSYNKAVRNVMRKKNDLSVVINNEWIHRKRNGKIS
jgi:hypothetical protein